MKGRALILIFLFLLTITVAHAETTDDVFTHSDSISTDFEVTAGTDHTAEILYINSVWINDIETLGSMKLITAEYPSAAFYSVPEYSEYNGVSLSIDGIDVGDGLFGYSQNPDKTVVFIHLWIQEDSINIEGFTGQKTLVMNGNSVELRGTATTSRTGLHNGAPSADTTQAFFSYTSALTLRPNSHTGEYNIDSSYVQQFNFNYTDGFMNRMVMERSAGLQSMVRIEHSGYEIYNESSLQTNDFDWMDKNTSWTVYNENVYGDIQTKTLYFGDVTDYNADISFNQTFYTDPEDIQVSWDVDNFDGGSYVYEIQVITSESGDFSQDSWPADGNWNVSPFISSASGAAVFDFYSDGYDLPIWIQAELWAQDKNTGTWTRLDSTPVERYHEKSDFGVGSIWTEKSTYNLSEMFYIFVETDYSIIDIELISDTYHDRQTLEVFEGGWQRLGYAFFSPHNFTAYLYEDGVITNQTSFSVWTTSPMLNIFLDSEALKTQFAFEFYTDNSSDTITGYKPDGSIFYGPITDLETNGREIISGVSSSFPPGIYTISLFHDGTTYYNDTIELYSTSEWVYFDASKYETGDRIKIYSFVTDSRQQVRLTDSIGTAVITWTDSAGYIVPNSQTVLYFSLTDNNEYGMNVNTSIDAGTFRTGNWKVEIIGIDGKPLTNESTYDYTTVSKRIESPTDTSNEMISIFFSPEGAFMLYTVCLTMMGLMLAKHPAGGGAGATVGVGFGVYFNVLPPWMLMLTVILLVVLGGVSVAAYYRGK